MNTHKRAELMLERIGSFCKVINICILELKMKDVVILQKKVSLLYHFFHQYTEGWDCVNKLLSEEKYIDFDTFISSPNYKNDEKEDVTEVKDANQEFAFEQFMRVIEDMDCSLIP